MDAQTLQRKLRESCGLCGRCDDGRAASHIVESDIMGVVVCSSCAYDADLLNRRMCLSWLARYSSVGIAPAPLRVSRIDLHVEIVTKAEAI